MVMRISRETDEESFQVDFLKPDQWPYLRAEFCHGCRALEFQQKVHEQMVKQSWLLLWMMEYFKS
jgi:hypothetical protein